MDFIKYHRVIEEDGETVILLYVDPQLSEFAEEFRSSDDPVRKQSFENKIKEYIKKNINVSKAKSIKILAGSIVLSQIVFSPIFPTNIEAAEYNMSYLFFGSTTQQIAFVDRTKESVNTVSPSYFDINADGSLDLSGQFSTTFINEMKERGVEVTPFLSNHWNREVGRAALQNREALSTQIADTIIEYDLDGVNIDIENVTDVDREAYTDLVRLIRQKLPPDKKVSVAVAANPYGWTKGWHGSYDYRELAKYSDYLMIMAYDESYQGGPSGPVASYSWVEKSVKYALDQGVPPEKLVLGMPFFGRYWNDAEPIGGYGLSRREAELLINQFNGSIYYDEETKSVKGTFTIKDTDTKPYISGRTLKAGNYTVWYEDERSIQGKIDLVHKYNLKGTGSWALGQENPEMWNSYKMWLEGTPFHDIGTHWAREDIMRVHEKGWMVGTSTNAFSPDAPLTRAQAAVIMARALNLQPVSGDTQVAFVDIESHWASKEIELVADNGLMYGVGDEKFAPDQPLTREQFSVILDRILIDKGVVSDADVTGEIPFADVSADRWSVDSIERMNNLGIIQGMSKTSFKPVGTLTRAQMAAMMNRAAPYLEG